MQPKGEDAARALKPNVKNIPPLLQHTACLHIEQKIAHAQLRSGKRTMAKGERLVLEDMEGKQHLISMRPTAWGNLQGRIVTLKQGPYAKVTTPAVMISIRLPRKWY